jgi:nucleoside-diphosphate-sugar epimerase
MIENKFQAEQTIINSGIPYLIFRPTWFFESLDLMIRDGKATLLGKQSKPSHWVAADDLARMVATAYRMPEAKNKIFFIFGPEQHLMKDLLEKYCKLCYPEIKKVSSVPIWIMKMVGLFTGNKELKGVASLFAYFEKVNELGNPVETNTLLGKPTTTFENWVKSKAS